MIKGKEINLFYKKTKIISQKGIRLTTEITEFTKALSTMVTTIVKNIGKYFIFLRSMFSNRILFRICIQQVLEECINIGINSLFIVTVISLAIGAVTTMQTAWHLTTIFIPKFVLGLAVRNMTISELAPTVIGIIFAGKVGSSIASELGSMRISEQIDALEIMGINAINYLVLPKMIATILMYPLLVIIAMFLALYGGYLSCALIKSLGTNPEIYIEGIRYDFDPYEIRVCIYKSITFAFFISSISCYKGFYISGGAFEVGKASTSAVTNSFMAILISEWFLTKLLL